MIESLEVDAVMDEHDIDTVITPPADGLTGYRDAVANALARGPLPSDPHWAHVGRGLRPAKRRGVVVVGLSGMPVRAAVASMCSITFLPKAVSPGNSIG